MNPYNNPYPTGPPQGMPMPGAPSTYGYQGYSNVYQPTPNYNMPPAQPYGSQPMPQAQYPAYGAPNACGQQYPYTQGSYLAPNNTYAQEPYGYNPYGGQYQQQNAYNQSGANYGYPVPSSVGYNPYAVPEGQNDTSSSGGTSLNPHAPPDSLANFGSYDNRMSNENEANPSALPSSYPGINVDQPSAKRSSHTQPSRSNYGNRGDERTSDVTKSHIQKNTGSLAPTNAEWKGISETVKADSPKFPKEDPEVLTGVTSNNAAERALYKKNLDALASLMTDVDLDEANKKS